jgi:hypothetical protein
MYWVNASRRGSIYPEVDNGSIHVHDIELRMDANTADDTVQELLDLRLFNSSAHAGGPHL